jgi:selenocysteine-specific elongation factor
VDHGKSTLVRALTGIDPDRLREEKAREMTIDLGFAWLTLPSGREVSVVDVPGHERFIKNMLAGVGGIDAAVLVIAADEGVMPQTAEHLAILDLLGVTRGVAALSKRDMVDDEWLELVREEVADRLQGTTMERAPLVAVSARTGHGLHELRRSLDDVLSDAESRPNGGAPRLPVDRVFTMQGFGTIVTGTLLEGSLRVGQELEALPRGLRTRVRGLQTHKHRVEEADPGRRLAANLAGLSVEDLRRGDVLAPVGAIRPTTRFDARVTLVEGAPKEVAHGSKLDLFVGAAETVATVGWLDRDQLRAGESCYAQVRTQEPLALIRGDRFILRQPSPSLTVAGGTVLEPHGRRRRRKDEATLRAMETLERGRPQDLALAALARSGPTERATLEKSLGEAASVLDSLADAGELVEAVSEGSRLLFTRAQWEALSSKARDAVATHHRQHPLRPGMPREELKSRLRLQPRVFSELTRGMRSRGLLEEVGSVVRLPGFEVRFEGAPGAEADRILGAIETAGHTPPAPAELGADPEVLAALVEVGRLVRLSEAVLYPPDVYTPMVEATLGRIDEAGTVTVAQVRDLFGVSRKYALALLEHMDAIRLTRRQGDERVRR